MKTTVIEIPYHPINEQENLKEIVVLLSHCVEGLEGLKESFPECEYTFDKLENNINDCCNRLEELYNLIF